MKHTYALCPTRKELVWLENPPVKPNVWRPMPGDDEAYEKAITQAIAYAPVVKEGGKEILLKIFPAGSPLVDMDLLTEGTPYEVEIEGEMVIVDQWKVNNYDEWKDGRTIGPNFHRQVCRLIPKPKQETLKDWMRKMG